MIFLLKPYVVCDQAEDNLFAGPVEGTKAVQTHLRRTSWVKKPLHLSPIFVLHWWLWNVRQRPLFTQITCTMRMVWTLMSLSMPIPSFGIKKYLRLRYVSKWEVQHLWSCTACFHLQLVINQIKPSLSNVRPQLTFNLNIHKVSWIPLLVRDAFKNVLADFFPLRGGGYHPTPLRKKSAKKQLILAKKRLF